MKHCFHANDKQIAQMTQNTVKAPALPKTVAKVINAYPAAARKRLLAIREVIFETAAKNPEVGTISETLKWGEPAYLTEESGSGSTIRIDFKEKDPDHVSLFFNCQTTLVGQMRREFPGEFSYVENRQVQIPLTGRLPKRVLSQCIAMALMYHRNKLGR